jgi:hypothetical protein
VFIIKNFEAKVRVYFSQKHPQVYLLKEFVQKVLQSYVKNPYIQMNEQNINLIDVTNHDLTMDLLTQEMLK